VSDRRRARIQRINRKRPPYTVIVDREPDANAADELVAVLFDVLAPLVRR
jgi:hypothetical protein